MKESIKSYFEEESTKHKERRIVNRESFEFFNGYLKDINNSFVENCKKLDICLPIDITRYFDNDDVDLSDEYLKNIFIFLKNEIKVQQNNIKYMENILMYICCSTFENKETSHILWSLEIPYMLSSIFDDLSDSLKYLICNILVNLSYESTNKQCDILKELFVNKCLQTLFSTKYTLLQSDISLFISNIVSYDTIIDEKFLTQLIVSLLDLVYNIEQIVFDSIYRLFGVLFFKGIDWDNTLIDSIWCKFWDVINRKNFRITTDSSFFVFSIIHNIINQRFLNYIEFLDYDKIIYEILNNTELGCIENCYMITYYLTRVDVNYNTEIIPNLLPALYKRFNTTVKLSLLTVKIYCNMLNIGTIEHKIVLLTDGIIEKLLLFLLDYDDEDSSCFLMLAFQSLCLIRAKSNFFNDVKSIYIERSWVNILESINNRRNETELLFIDDLLSIFSD